MERYNITDLLRIGLRRFFWVFIPFTIILTVCLVGLGLLPARYHSKALLIVEDQQISPDLVPSAIRARAEDRLQTIKASLRSRENIIELSDRFDLIDRNSDVPFSKRVEAVKEDILISISRVSNTRRSRRGDEPTTITFEIGFVHEDRQTAFRVANQLVTDFLSQNVEARIEVAEDTAAFMRDEERDLRRQIDQVQTQIAEVRRQNPGMAPETIAFNQDTIRRLTEDIEDFEARIEARNQELDLLRAQQPLIIDASSRNDTDRQELREKRRQYTAFSRRYTDQHPDMVMLLDELLALEERLEPEAFLDRASKTVDQLSTRLASGNLRPGESRELRLMRNDLEARIVKVQAVGGEQSLPELTFRTRESSMLTQIAGYRDRLVTLREDLAEAEARLEQAPTVQAQLSTLENEEERLQRQLGTTQTARARAERTESLEEQQKAERVLILDPPVLPDVPTSPDKPRVALLLTAAAGGFAAFLGIAPVFVSPRIDSRRQLSQVVPGLTVIEVPEIVDDEERKFRRNVMVGLVILSGFLTLVLAAVAYVVLIR
ncbi:MAG: hypothetical protein HRU11_04240 [Parvularculaceae bacterium]|nr:hypothetical protein [Parvularculaceae bacterium]